MTKVVNFYGAPSSGKTTCAAKIYTFLKEKGYNAVLVQEYASELILEENMKLVRNQRILFEEQLKRIERAYGKADYVIVDSPLLLNVVYKRFQDRIYVPSFEVYVKEWNSSFDNLNIFLKFNNQEFDNRGRITTKSDNLKIEMLIKEVLNESKEKYIETTKEDIDKIQAFLLKDK